MGPHVLDFQTWTWTILRCRRQTNLDEKVADQVQKHLPASEKSASKLQSGQASVLGTGSPPHCVHERKTPHSSLALISRFSPAPFPSSPPPSPQFLLHLPRRGLLPFYYPDKHAHDAGQVLAVYLGVILGIYYQVVLRSAQHLNTTDRDQVEEPKSFVTAIVQENALLTVLRINARLDIIIEPRIQTSACDTEIRDTLDDHRPREVTHQAVRCASGVRTEIWVSREETDGFVEWSR